MGKIRYYCEYCDRSFLDDLKARKKHLTGTQHSRMRKQYYLAFSGAKEIYEEEKGKEPCRKFLMFNSCPFGNNCKYSHYDLERLRLQAEQETFQSSNAVTIQSVNEALSKLSPPEKVDDWLRLWKAKQENKPLKPAKLAVQAVSSAWSCDLPPRLKEYTNLPPSLQPWSMFDLQNVHLEDWG